MKIIHLYFLAIIGSMLFSCSDDDSNEQINQNSTKTIFANHIRVFVQGEVDRTLSRYYENNKPKTDSIFDSDSNLILYTNWVYDNDKLILRETFLSTGNQATEFNIVYDDLGRISQTIESSNNFIRTTDFAYNNDNTITSTSDVNGTTSVKTFSLDANGIIDTETNGNETYSATYDIDNNLILLSTPFEVSTFTYDNVNLPPTDFPVYEQFMFGNYINNYIIYSNSLESAPNNSASTLIKYPITRENGSSITTTEWILDSENYPIMRKVYNQNQLSSESDYIYN